MFRKEYLIVFALIAVAFIPSAGAINYEYNCTNGVLYKSGNVTVSGTIIPVDSNSTCLLGCAENRIECLSPMNVPSEIYISIPFCLVLLAILFGYLSIKTSDDDWPLSVLFIFTTLILSWNVAGFLMEFSTLTQEGVTRFMTNIFTMFMYIIMIFVVYMIFNIIDEKILQPMFDKRKKKREREM